MTGKLTVRLVTWAEEDGGKMMAGADTRRIEMYSMRGKDKEQHRRGLYKIVKTWLLSSRMCAVPQFSPNDGVIPDTAQGQVWRCFSAHPL